MNTETPKQNNNTPLDRNQLQQVRNNYLALNAHRLHFAREIFSENQQLYLDLLPALLHFNHPMLPGYSDRQTPAGVYQYQAPAPTLSRLQRLAKSFHPNRSKNQRPDIVSIFTMGSLGSVAQNSQSDIDVWLCYRSDLSQTGIDLLAKKTKRITEWATTLGIDTTIFLMNPSDFNRGENQALDKESSGNMQHFLLLDEFYRTAIFIAGQLPIWPFTINHHAKEYLAETQQLLNEKRLPDKQMIDFGVIDHIPKGEFISAAIWQLYKAIESPYKSIIKLLLIEIYATKNHAEAFLSNQFKQWLHRNKIDETLSIDTYDPFHKSYLCIESYLNDTGQTERLALIRRCFYFKIAHPIVKNKSVSSEQKTQFIRRIGEQWQWDEQFIQHLNQREHWKIATVNQERREIIRALNESYRFIVDLCKKGNTEIQASNKELNILGRKLHAAFSIKSGKVDWLNPGISSDISETHIHLKKMTPNNWCASGRNAEILNKKSLIELLVNLHCNQILSKKTYLKIDNSSVIPLEKIREKIASNIPTPLASADHNQFEKKCRTKKIILFIHSFEKPDYYLIPDQPDQQAYYYKQSCIIDLVNMNSWNEITCQQFKGKAEHIIPEIFSQFITDPHCLDHLHIQFFDENIAQSLRPYFANLRKSISDFFNAHHQGRFIIKHSTGYIGLSNLASEAAYQSFENINNVHQKLSVPQISFCALGVDKASLHSSILSLFAHLNRENCIQLFFNIKGKIAELTIIDEQGTLTFLSIPYRNPQHSLLPIYTFCRAVNERRMSSSSQELSPLEILPISIYQLHRQAPATGKEPHWRAEQLYLNNQAALQTQFLIHGIAEHRENDFIFTLYCADQCFNEADEQAEAFVRLIRWMRGHTQDKKPLNYTVADLDISHCQAAFSPAKTLNTAHFLQVKSVLEQKMSRALATVKT